MDGTSPGNMPIGFVGWTLEDFNGTALEYQRASACCAPAPTFQAFTVELGGAQQFPAAYIANAANAACAASPPESTVWRGPTPVGWFAGALFSSVQPQRLTDEDVERIADRVIAKLREAKP